ncbi:MAG: PilZ domain-containing protein [Candidatus Acidiferrales bacterium]
MDPILSPSPSRIRARRRSKRLRLVVPVDVIGFEGETELFREAAHMHCVSAHGGLVVMAASVAIGQVLQLVNRNTRERQDCRVVHVENAENSKWAAGVEFLQPAGNFWQISFPPLHPFAQDARN